MSRGLTVSLIAALIILALAVAGMGAYLFLHRPDGTGLPLKPVQAEQKPPPEPVYVNLKNFVTDLADKDRMRYVDVTITLGMRDQIGADMAKRLEPQLRHVILSTLRQSLASNLAGAQGKAGLAEVLQVKLSESLREHLIEIYITDLVVQ